MLARTSFPRQAKSFRRKEADRKRRNLLCRADASLESHPAVENVVIIGSGPAGYTAAIYAARANLKPLVFEGYQAGGVRGGQLMTTTEVENFPGFPDGITGPDLMDRMRQQAERWGSELHTEDVEFVDLSERPFTVRSSDREVKANAIILATGATAKRLDIPSEHDFWSRGISACAICDGASPQFKGQELAVVGGGDTATEEAIYLTKYGKHVHLLVRGEQMRASKAMQTRVLENKNVTVHLNTQVEDAYADEKGQMAGLHLVDTATNEKRDLEVRGLFYGIGHQPNSGIVADQVETDSKGYVKVRNGGPQTSVEGVFSAGDLHDTEWRQAVTAAGSGCQAAIACERYLTEKNLLQEFANTYEEKPAKAKVDAHSTTKDEFDSNAVRFKGQYALRKLYHESDKLISVLYTSPTCGPCRTLKPILSKIVDEYDEKIKFVEIDIEEDPEIAEAAGVMGTPCLHLFKDKKRVQVINGVKMKSDYRKAIETNA